MSQIVPPAQETIHPDSAGLHATKHRIPLPALFNAWFQIGIQSFGGGQSTLSLIQRKLDKQNGWITPDDFVRVNAMSNMAPGINLIAITILLGVQLSGPLGVVASLAGLLLPSVAVTILMTAGYTHISHMHIVMDAFHGIVPATVGIGALTAFTVIATLLKQSKNDGNIFEVLAGLCVIVASGYLVTHHAPVIAILLGGGIVMAIVHASIAGRKHKSTPLDVLE